MPGRFRSPTPHPKQGLTTATLTFALFCYVSGGPYGLEPIIQAAGPLFAIVLIAVLPFIWALPDALTTAELSAAIPEEGGYTVWVNRALGPFPAFLDAWWTWLYALVDCAIYPALFLKYFLVVLSLVHVGGGLGASPGAQAGIGGLVILGAAWLNARGSRTIGLASGWLTLALTVPFVALLGVSVWRLCHGFHVPPGLWQAQNPDFMTAVSAALPLALWNYLGWNALSTVAGEVEQPERAYPRAIGLALIAVTLCYALPTLATLPFAPDATKWGEGSWPALATLAAGGTVGLLVGIGALASPLAQFSTGLLASSRIPFALAAAGYLPRFLADLHTKSGTPTKSIWLSAAIIAVLCTKSLAELLALNVILFSSALLLEGISLIVLRKKEPSLPRPYRIPGGWVGVGLIAALPALVSLILIFTSVRQQGWRAQIPTAAAIASGPLLYIVSAQLRKRSSLRAPA